MGVACDAVEAGGRLGGPNGKSVDKPYEVKKRGSQVGAATQAVHWLKLRTGSNKWLKLVHTAMDPQSPAMFAAPTPAPTPAPAPARHVSGGSTRARQQADVNPLNILFRDLLGSPIQNAGQLALAPPPPALTPVLQNVPSAPPSADRKNGGGWSFFFGGGSSDEHALRRQVRDYEQRLAEMRDLASRQAADIASLRTVAERTFQDKADSRDEERWRLLHEQALANGQRQLHELAASLQASQRTAAQQQVAEWRQALHEASEAHAQAVSQLQCATIATANGPCPPSPTHSSASPVPVDTVHLTVR